MYAYSRIDRNQINHQYLGSFVNTIFVSFIQKKREKKKKEMRKKKKAIPIDNFILQRIQIYTFAISIPRQSRVKF